MTRPTRQEINERSAYERWCWGGPAKADEHVESTRRRGAAHLNAESIRRLACAMIEGAFDDIRRSAVVRASWFQIARDYRPDPDGARRWLASESDEPLSFVWCCQVTGLSPDAIRAKVPRRRTESSTSARTAGGRVHPQAAKMDALLGADGR